MEVMEVVQILEESIAHESNPERASAYAHAVTLVRRITHGGVADRYRVIYETQGPVEAIKAYRGEFNKPLMDSKVAIEKMAAEFRWKRPG